MKGLVVFLVGLIVVVVGAQLVVKWLRTVDSSPVPRGFGGRNP